MAKRVKVAWLFHMTYIDSPVMANYPIEGMRAKVGNDTDYQFMAFNQIEGFTFKSGYAYELRVERTTLGNPPADACRYTYKLIDELLIHPVECTRETVRLYVSAEMGNYDWGIPQMDDAHCMKIRESVNVGWTNVPFNKIEGFTYEDGNAYELSVEKITLHAQPTDEICPARNHFAEQVTVEAGLHPTLSPTSFLSIFFLAKTRSYSLPPPNAKYNSIVLCMPSKRLLMSASCAASKSCCAVNTCR